MREIFLDTETTGLDPTKGHRVIEIACIAKDGGMAKTKNVFHTYLNPRRIVPEEAFRIHGISTEFLSDKPLFEHIAHDFLSFIDGSKLVIHNAAFDIKFLNHELMLAGLSQIKVGNNVAEIVDTLQIARKKFPGGQNSLDGLCRRFRIDLSKRVKHGALLDTELLSEVYLEMMGGAQISITFGGEHESVAKESNARLEDTSLINGVEMYAEDGDSEVRATHFPYRKFTPLPEDIEIHKAFMISNFKKNLWGYE